MKKIIALLLAATMLFGATAAMAEAAADSVAIQSASIDFDVTAVVPEGYTMTEDRFNDTVVLEFQPTAEDNNTAYILSIAYSEAYDGETLNELSDEEKQTLLDELDEDFEEVEVHDLTTDHGTQVYLLNEKAAEADSSFATGFTIYKGYFINVYVIRGDYEALTQEDIDTAMKIISDVWFVEK